MVDNTEAAADPISGKRSGVAPGAVWRRGAGGSELAGCRAARLQCTFGTCVFIWNGNDRPL